MHNFIRDLMPGLILLSSGSSEPTVDAFSEDPFYRATGRMTEALPVEEHDSFTDGLMTVVLAGVDFTAAPGEGSQLDLAAAMARLDNMTTGQVVADAEALRRGHGADLRHDASQAGSSGQ